MSCLLVPDSTQVFSPTLAQLLGSADAAIALQQIHYWLSKECGKVIEGIRWIFNTYAQWHEQFPWLSEWKLRKIFHHLRELKILRFEQHDRKRWNQRGYYTIDYEELEALHRSMCGFPTDRSADSHNIDVETAHTSICTENTSENTSENTPTHEGGVSEKITSESRTPYPTPLMVDSQESYLSPQPSLSDEEDSTSPTEGQKEVVLPQEEELKRHRVDVKACELKKLARKYGQTPPLHNAVVAWLQWAKKASVVDPTGSLIKAIKQNWQPETSPREQWWQNAALAWGRDKRDRLINGVVDDRIYFKNGRSLELEKALGMNWDELASLGGGA